MTDRERVEEAIRYLEDMRGVGHYMPKAIKEYVAAINRENSVLQARVKDLEDVLHENDAALPSGPWPDDGSVETTTDKIRHLHDRLEHYRAECELWADRVEEEDARAQAALERVQEAIRYLEEMRGPEHAMPKALREYLARRA